MLPRRGRGSARGTGAPPDRVRKDEAAAQQLDACRSSAGIFFPSRSGSSRPHRAAAGGRRGGPPGAWRAPPRAREGHAAPPRHPRGAFGARAHERASCDGSSGGAGCRVQRAVRSGARRGRAIVNFLAVLELARESLLEVTQAEPFAPIYVGSSPMLNPDEVRGRARGGAARASSRFRPELGKMFDEDIGAGHPAAAARSVARCLEGRGVELVGPGHRLALPDARVVQKFLERHPPREAAALLARRAGDARDHRLPAAGDARGYRRHSRRPVSPDRHPGARGSRLDRRDRAPEAPGRPALYATTEHFLDDLGLRSLEELPLWKTWPRHLISRRLPAARPAAGARRARQSSPQSTVQPSAGLAPAAPPRTRSCTRPWHARASVRGARWRRAISLPASPPVNGAPRTLQQRDQARDRVSVDGPPVSAGRRGARRSRAC